MNLLPDILGCLYRVKVGVIHQTTPTQLLKELSSVQAVLHPMTGYLTRSNYLYA